MKKGYIVWNATNYGDGYEFFGAYRSLEKAQKALRKVLRQRFGKVPKNEEELTALEEEMADATDGCLDSYRITAIESM